MTAAHAHQRKHNDDDNNDDNEADGKHNNSSNKNDNNKNDSSNRFNNRPGPYPCLDVTAVAVGVCMAASKGCGFICPDLPHNTAHKQGGVDGYRAELPEHLPERPTHAPD